MRKRLFALIALTTLLSAAKADETVYRVDRLVGTDLGYCHEGEMEAKDPTPTPIYCPIMRRYDRVHLKKKVKTINRRVLSLKQGEKWDAGTVTLVQEWALGSSKTYHAWSGQYFVFGTSESDVLLVRLSMQKYFRGTSGKDGITWERQIRWIPVGVDFELALDEGTLPEKPVLSAKIGFFVDEKGLKTQRYYSPDTFGEKLVGRGSERRARPDFAEVGKSLRLGPVMFGKEAFATDLPPGMKIRTK